METTGILRFKPARKNRCEEDWISLVDDDGMPFVLSEIRALDGKWVRLTIVEDTNGND